MMWLSSCLAGVMMASVCWSAGADRTAGDPKATRSVVMARNGMVATSHPLAVQAGLDVLRRGGNAVDAAIAANAVLGVVEPMSCGVGGDLFAIVWDAKTGKLYGLNASGRSPYAATRELFAQRGLTEIPERGPLSWSVPGCVDGWEELRARFGSLSFEQVLAPAIQYAEEGFPVTEIIGSEWRRYEKLLKASPDAARTYLRADRSERPARRPDATGGTGDATVERRAPRIGEVMTNPYLAATYRLIARDGRDAFYRGEIARRIVAYSESAGGLFTLRDFAEHTSTWVEPVSTNYRGYDVWELPPNGQGIAVLQILNLLEPFDLKALGHNSAEYLHLLIEAKKLAYEDRARFYADPDWHGGGQDARPPSGRDVHLPGGQDAQPAGVPSVAELISKAYAERRLKLIDLERAARELPAGNDKIGRADTVYLTVVDKDRNAVSLIQSVYYAWGSGLAPGDLGFCLQNRGCLFALDETHANRLEPHKRPFHTIIPAMVTRDGRPWLSFGVMGGDMQPQGQVQVLCNMIDFGMNVQQAGEAARCRHDGSSTPTGGRMTDGGSVTVESGISEQAVAGLKARGHDVSRGRGGFGGYQAILIDHENGVLQGGSDPRKDGCAAGY